MYHVQLVSGSFDRLHAETSVSSLQVRSVVDKFADYANSNQLYFPRIVINGRQYTQTREIYDMFHAVNEYSTHNGGAAVF